MATVGGVGSQWEGLGAATSLCVVTSAVAEAFCWLSQGAGGRTG